MEKLLLKDIRSHIPKEYYDCTRSNGLSLAKNSYSLFKRKDEMGKPTNQIVLLTAPESNVLNILKDHYEVLDLQENCWIHYEAYEITHKPSK